MQDWIRQENEREYSRARFGRHALERDLNRERDGLSQLYQYLQARNPGRKCWVYGHFHYSHREVVDGIKRIMLEEGELPEIPNRERDS